MECKRPSGSRFEVKVRSGQVMTIWDDFLLAGKECRRIQELRILCIPLSQSRPEDVLVWNDKNTGVYSVRSGYKLLQREVYMGRYKLILLSLRSVDKDVNILFMLGEITGSRVLKTRYE
ncbi:hypothetical protein CXB51_010823 [Gossypium anomalum]|uniref:Uncharacterized protein n=1 Tax=Gossypium anomalum TaxID=47600 RepID=A0A8J6D4L7_9ROSI|nr:hypothetical protein CXB51_010823 [Gossypium anomalum]